MALGINWADEGSRLLAREALDHLQNYVKQCKALWAETELRK